MSIYTKGAVNLKYSDRIKKLKSGLKTWLDVYVDNLLEDMMTEISSLREEITELERCNGKVIKVDIWKNGKDGYKDYFTGYFSTTDTVDEVRKMFKGIDVKIGIHILEGNDDYYLKKAKRVRDLIRSG